jgi:hypothetical protein
MKAVLLILLASTVLFSCKSQEEKRHQAYCELVETTMREYGESAERGYQAQIRFAEYIKDSMRRGIAFPDNSVLVWTYPRIALAAEYSGRKEEAVRMYAFAEEFEKQVYPGEPTDRSGRFKTLRDAVIYMDRAAGVLWLKEAKTGPNQALQHNDPSCHVSCLRTPRASRGRG